jgi:membrane-associated protease RseP (regulator of RpoE activity)
MRLGEFDVEVRWSWLALLAAYVFAGAVTAAAGGHLDLGGRDGIVVHAAAFAALALAAALFHELGHALAGVAFGRRPLRLVLKGGAAMQIEGARPGSRGASAHAESLVALSGPIASALIGLAYVNVSTSFTTPFAWAGLLAFFDGLLNLIPVVHSDGSRIIHAFTRPAPR